MNTTKLIFFSFNNVSIEPEWTINMESKKWHSEIEMKTTEKDVKLDGLLIDFRNNLTQTHGKNHIKKINLK